MPANAVIAATNLRLGVSLPGPRYIRALHAPGFAAPQWIRLRRFTYLFKEIASAYDLDDRYVYVTDGGQLDNLGLPELLSRQCETIMCIDASGDPDRSRTSTPFPRGFNSGPVAG